MSRSSFKLEFTLEDLMADTPKKEKQKRKPRKKSEGESLVKKPPVARAKKKSALADISVDVQNYNGPTSSKRMREMDAEELKRMNNELTKTAAINRPANQVNWSKVFQPKTIDDLLIHPKKLEEIRNWFMLIKENPAHNILLLTGPSGCCKLSSIQVIAQESGFNVCEYKSMYDVDYDLLFNQNENNGMIRYGTPANKFSQFLFASSRSQSLFQKNPGRRLMVVKEFPNAFIYKNGKEEFWTIMREYKAKYNEPVIFMVTESNCNTDIEYLLFPDEFCRQLNIYKIKMNAIAVTTMKKALKQICNMLSKNQNSDIPFLQPTLGVIDNIAVQSQGDLRSAISNLQIASQKGSVNLSLQLGGSKNSGKKQGAKAKLNEGVGKDEQLDIFHAIGRVLYPKLVMNEKTKRLQLTNNPEIIAEQFELQSVKFQELLHSNYLKYFDDIDSVTPFADILSKSIVFQSKYEEAEQLHKLNFAMTARAAMVHNNSKRKGFLPINQYMNKKFKNSERENDVKYQQQSVELNGGHRSSKKDFFSDFEVYASIIKPKEEDKPK